MQVLQQFNTFFLRPKATYVADVLRIKLTCSGSNEEEEKDDDDDKDESDENENDAGKTEAKKLTRREAVQELFLQVKFILEDILFDFFLRIS